MWNLRPLFEIKQLKKNDEHFAKKALKLDENFKSSFF